jgi:hypothetical protein
MGHKTTNARLSNMVLRCLELVEGVADVIFRQVMSGTHCHSDATGFPVLAPGSDSTHLGQIFCFSWGKLVALRYAADKKGVTFAMLAERFRGTMILDASSTHHAALATGRIIEAGCNAHGLRKFREAKDSDAILAAEGERWISSWFVSTQLRHLPPTQGPGDLGSGGPRCPKQPQPPDGAPSSRRMLPLALRFATSPASTV